MRILHIVTGLIRTSGVSVFVAELAAEQVILGHDVSILVKHIHSEAYPLPGTIKMVGTTNEHMIFDVVHVHALWDPWLTRQALKFKKIRIPIVWSPHGMLTPWALKHKWLKKCLGLLCYQYWSLRDADLLHVTASTERDDVRRLRLKNPLVLAPLGVRTSKSLDNASLACNGGKKTILFVSRIQRKKGLPNLLEAWAGIPEALRVQWQIKIAGPDQENHVEELRRQCHCLGIANEVVFLGPVFGREKERLYREADIFVLPTHSENFGSVVVEALGEGTPVICTKGAPWGELETYGCGRWVDIGVEPLRTALMEMMALSTEKRREMGERGRRLVLEKYTWQSVAMTVLKGYKEILEAHHA